MKSCIQLLEQSPIVFNSVYFQVSLHMTAVLNVRFLSLSQHSMATESSLGYLSHFSIIFSLKTLCTSENLVCISLMCVKCCCLGYIEVGTQPYI